MTPRDHILHHARIPTKRLDDSARNATLARIWHREICQQGCARRGSTAGKAAGNRVAGRSDRAIHRPLERSGRGGHHSRIPYRLSIPIPAQDQPDAGSGSRSTDYRRPAVAARRGGHRTRTSAHRYRSTGSNGRPDRSAAQARLGPVRGTRGRRTRSGRRPSDGMRRVTGKRARPRTWINLPG